MIEANRPFMSIVTRACMRPVMLSENIQSVKAQSCQDVEQIFIIDHTRKGIQAADRALDKHKEHISGDYVYILDDDCTLIHDFFVEMIKDVIDLDDTVDIVMVKSRRPPGPPSRQSLVPVPKAWDTRTLYHGACNCLCYVVRRELWIAHIKQFGVRPWGGDWVFLEALLNLEPRPRIYWLDEIVADCRQLGRGRIFETDKSDWFAPVAKEHGLEKITNDVWRLPLWQI